MRDTLPDDRSSRDGSERTLSRRGLLRASGTVVAGTALAGRAAGAEAGGDGGPRVVWNRTYGDERRQRGLSVVQAPDGGFVIVGETGVDSADDYADALVLRTNAVGDVEWTRTYGDEEYQSASEILADPEGGYVVVLEVGTADSYANHVAAMGLDADGTVRWQRAYEFGELSVRDAIRRSGGGYAIVGGLDDDPSPPEAFLLTVDAAGRTEDFETYDAGEVSLLGRAVVETDDGFGLLTSTTPTNTDWSPVLVRTGPDGTERWRRQYEIRGSDVGEGMVRGADGGFVIAGHARGVKCVEYYPGQFEWSTTERDAFLLKVDDDGRRQWEETFSAPGPAYASADATAVVQRPGGGYAFAGSREAGWGSPFWIVGTDADGECVWQRRAGGRQYNFPFSMIRTADDGYAVTGYTTGGHPAEPDLRLIRLTADS